mgnify:CR=1 FL=1
MQAGVERTPEVWRARPFCRSCGLCCKETEMILAPSDVARLERLGYSRREFAVFDGRFYRLRNVGGYCYFYNRGSGLCRVYPYRPLGCAIYPIVYDANAGRFTLDEECPLAYDTKPEEMEKARRLLRYLLRELGMFRR